MGAAVDAIKAHQKKRGRRMAIADTLNDAGMHRAAPGLYLRVRDGARGQTKVWFHRYNWRGTPRADSLGNVHEVTEMEAAQMVDEGTLSVSKGNDPRGDRAITKTGSMLFKDAAEDFLAVQFPELARNKRLDEEKIAEAPKQKRQWVGTLRSTYADIGELTIEQLEPDHIAECLRDDWRRIPVTARRVRGRIEAVIDYAIARKLRTNQFNPANQRTIDVILRSNTDIKPVEHFKALPFGDVPDFAKALRGQKGVGALAFQLLLFTVKRTSEVLLAEKEEFNMNKRTWSIPRARMKVKKGPPHVVPLSDSACEIVEGLLRMKLNSPYLFPGQVQGQPLSSMIMLNIVDRMGFSGEMTAHGLRSSFKEWSRNTRVELPPTGVDQRELTELSLDHLFGSNVERAYGRDQLLDLRRPLMDAWAAFLVGNVVTLKKAA